MLENRRMSGVSMLKAINLVDDRIATDAEKMMGFVRQDELRKTAKREKRIQDGDIGGERDLLNQHKAALNDVSCKRDELILRSLLAAHARGARTRSDFGGGDCSSLEGEDFQVKSALPVNDSFLDNDKYKDSVNTLADMHRNRVRETSDK